VARHQHDGCRLGCAKDDVHDRRSPGRELGRRVGPHGRRRGLLSEHLQDQKTTLGSNLFDMVNTVTASGNNVVVTFKGLRLTRSSPRIYTTFPIVPRGGLAGLRQGDDGSFLNVVT